MIIFSFAIPYCRNQIINYDGHVQIRQKSSNHMVKSHSLFTMHAPLWLRKIVDNKFNVAKKV